MDLSRMGTYLMIALLGLIIAMLINLFVASGPLDMIVSDFINMFLFILRLFEGSRR